jgi:phosphonate degradation associated HDIG domain protein
LVTGNKVVEILSRGTEKQYGGEAVSQLEHALQCAWLAEQAGSSPELITACLLHDIGHLLDPKAATAEGRQRDLQHEELGWRYLKLQFGPEVAEPVLLHVPAKRYLCFSNPAYWAELSPVSKHTLELQGGPFNSEEAARFLENSFARDGVQLRTWDDLAKVPGLETPDLAHFAAIMRNCH